MSKKISLPKELYDKLDVELGEEIEVIDLSKDSFTIRAAGAKKNEYAARWFLVPTVLTTLIFLAFAIYIHPHVVPLSGKNSIATGVLIIANAATILTFISAYIYKRKTFYRSMTKKIYWRTFATVIVALAIISTLGITAFFWFIEQIFHGVQFDIFTSTLMFGFFAAFLCYLAIFIVDTFSIAMLINMLIMVIIGGLASAMATNGDQYWWQHNFSQLGTIDSKASLQFNLTLVVAAALFIALIDYIFVSLREKVGGRIRFTILEILLVGSAVCIAGVGLIPANGEGIGHYWHNQLAMFIVYFMGIAILGIRWFLPKASKTLHQMSYLIVGLMIAVYLLWHPVHYLTLTAFEILEFTLAFGWLMLFIYSLTSILWDNHEIYTVYLEKDEKNKEKEVN